MSPNKIYFFLQVVFWFTSLLKLFCCHWGPTPETTGLVVQVEWERQGSGSESRFMPMAVNKILVWSFCLRMSKVELWRLLYVYSRISRSYLFTNFIELREISITVHYLSYVFSDTVLFAQLYITKKAPLVCIWRPFLDQ